MQFFTIQFDLQIFQVGELHDLQFMKFMYFTKDKQGVAPSQAGYFEPKNPRIFSSSRLCGGKRPLLKGPLSQYGSHPLQNYAGR
jgi:hypothetical protein